MRHDNYADFWLCYYVSDWTVMGEKESEDENERGEGGRGRGGGGYE